MISSSEILIDKKAQAHLNQFGYVCIDFTSSEVIDELKRLHLELFDQEDQNGFKVGLDQTDKALVAKSTEVIKEKLAQSAESTFEDYKIFTASYVVKYPGKDVIVPPHQDWTFTDESTYASYTVWIPLLDTTVQNGALAVIPGSHQLFDHPRSSPSPQSKSLIADHLYTLFPYCKPIEMKVGQALIFDNRTIHASTPNVSEDARLAVGIGIVKKEAPLWHYYQSPTKPNTLELYEVDEQFFIEYDNKVLGSRYDQGDDLNELKHLKSEERKALKLTGVEIESLVKSIEGNSWQQAVVDSVSMLKEMYHSPTPIKEEKTMDKEQNQNQDKGQEAKEWVDERTFFQKYTIPNIIAEIKWRLTGKAS